MITFFHTVNVSLDHCTHDATVAQAEAGQSNEFGEKVFPESRPQTRNIVE